MKILKIIAKLIVILMFSFAVILLFSQMWLLKTWSDLTAAEVLYHMLAPLNGTNPDMIKGYIMRYLIPALVIIIAIIVAVIVYTKKKEKTKPVYIILLIMSVIMIAFSIVRIERGVGVFSYAVNYLKAKKFQGEDFIEKNYTDPREVSLTFPEKKRNLIYIFLESAEMTFADKESGGDFDVNCIPELTELAKENEDFSADSDKLNGGISLPGTNWTMGAMFGMTSGLPLQTSLGANSMMNEDSFFEGVMTLGDILAEEGYDQRLLLGSEAKFGGRETYFKQHGNYLMKDYNWAIDEGKIPKDYYVWWGYEDEKLFEYAKEQLTEMAAEDEPFNLTMLTVDTHFPDGYVCDICEDKYDNQYANVFACSSRQTVQFIKWIQAQDFYEDTTIVISGDHPTMDPDFTDNVDKKYTRKTYTCILNSAAGSSTGKTREFSTLDMFPTTLAAMGVEIEGDKLGMGVNLYSDTKTLIEEYGEQVCSDKMNLPSAFMDKLGDIKITEKDLKRIKKARVSVVDTDTPGQMAVRQKNIRSIKAASVKKAEVEIINNKTGKTDVYNLDCVTDPDNPAIFSTIAYVELDEADIKDTTVKIYFTVEGIDHFEIGTWNYDEGEQKWIAE
ncbi:MAG TPA: phosphoglycerol transferase [Lachnospiraceae bacterium]|nr:phosphoglycerol transferase [Lachnospiraceae bacterium]